MRKRSRRLWLVLLVAVLAANYACAYALLRHQRVAVLGGSETVTSVHIADQGDLLKLWAFIPAMTVERLAGGRDTLIVDGVSWQTYRLSQSLPPLIADPNDRDRVPGTHC